MATRGGLGACCCLPTATGEFMFQVKWRWPKGPYIDQVELFDLINATPEPLTNPDGSNIGFKDGHVEKMDNGNVAYKSSGFRVTKELQGPFYVHRFEYEGSFPPLVRLFTKTAAKSSLFYELTNSWILDDGGAADPTDVLSFEGTRADPPYVIRGLIETFDAYADPLAILQLGGLESYMNAIHPTSTQTLRGYVIRKI